MSVTLEVVLAFALLFPAIPFVHDRGYKKGYFDGVNAASGMRNDNNDKANN